MHEVFDDVFNNLQKFKDAGAYGVIIEGMKFRKAKKGMIKIGGDCCYPYNVILNNFNKLKQEAHRIGLKIYAGENRIRKYGDSLTCCGIDGLDGFKGNRYNLNHILNGDLTKPTEKMKQNKTGEPFCSLVQETSKGRRYREQSFAYDMLDYYKENKDKIDVVMGVKK